MSTLERIAWRRTNYTSFAAHFRSPSSSQS